jgi:hypothetical protein
MVPDLRNRPRAHALGVRRELVAGRIVRVRRQILDLRFDHASDAGRNVALAQRVRALHGWKGLSCRGFDEWNPFVILYGEEVAFVAALAEHEADHIRPVRRREDADQPAAG